MTFSLLKWRATCWRSWVRFPVTSSFFTSPSLSSYKFPDDKRPGCELTSWEAYSRQTGYRSPILYIAPGFITVLTKGHQCMCTEPLQNNSHCISLWYTWMSFSHLRFSPQVVSSLQVLRRKFCRSFFISPIHATCPFHLIPFDLTILITFGEE